LPARSSTPPVSGGGWGAGGGGGVCPRGPRVGGGGARGGAQGWVLALVALGAAPPARRVGVAPFRGDERLARGDLPSHEPAGEEPLGLAVGAGGVEVAHPRLPGLVEDGAGPGPHRPAPLAPPHAP